MNNERIKEIEETIADLQTKLEALKAEKEFKLADTGFVAWPDGCVLIAKSYENWLDEAKHGVVMPTKELAELHGKLHQINGRLLQARHFLCPDWEWNGVSDVGEICFDGEKIVAVGHTHTPGLASVIFPDKQTAEKAIEISGVMGVA